MTETHRQGLRRATCRTSRAWSPKWAAWPKSRSPTRSTRSPSATARWRSAIIASRRQDRRSAARDRGKGRADTSPAASRWRSTCATSSARSSIANDLERIGDLAKNIAKRVIALNGEFPPPKLIRGVEHMTDLVLGQLKAVLDAYARRDLAKADGGVARRRGNRRALHLGVPRAAHLHDGRPAHHHASASICCSAPRTSSASATTPPTSPRRCIIVINGRPIAESRPKGDTTTLATLKAAGDQIREPK